MEGDTGVSFSLVHYSSVDSIYKISCRVHHFYLMHIIALQDEFVFVHYSSVDSIEEFFDSYVCAHALGRLKQAVLRENGNYLLKCSNYSQGRLISWQLIFGRDNHILPCSIC